MEPLVLFPLEPWAQSHNPPLNCNMPKEEAIPIVTSQLKEVFREGTAIYFTDGSFSIDNTGAAAVEVNGSKRGIKELAPKNIAKAQMELEGIKLALQDLLSRTAWDHKLQRLIIFSDSQGMLKKVSYPIQLTGAQQNSIGVLPPSLFPFWKVQSGHGMVPGPQQHYPQQSNGQYCRGSKF
ncbi:hypothetical protein O181_027705 [Austropuccinia psidii MF-1]|uniref:RNase H type-1 domain-containing protein n=1 Tax=Austropuccinia psidii MF-1 TaxID=1389203 RepID=A0A9Q3H3G7_9BASI|nr:hypothetical protein [Austropuccinia psidii MF-1]